MIKNKLTTSSFLFYLIFCNYVSAENSFDLKPVLLDSESSNSTILGLEYLYEGSKTINSGLTEIDSEDASDEIDPDETINIVDIEYFLKGTVTSRSDKNPKSFLDSKLSISYLWSDSFSFKSKAFVGYESDQSFDDKQLKYGLSTSMAKIDVFRPNNILAFSLNIDQVDPIKDEAREAVLGEDLETYNRIDLEFLYIYNLGFKNVDTLEFGYRYFREINAKELIKQENLDIFKTATYRIGFKRNFYVAYSTGELPFNQKDNRIYEIGFSYKFD